MPEPDKITTSKQDALSLINNKNTEAINPEEPGCGSPDFSVTPQQLLVAVGLLAGVLDVDSILIDRDQHVEIVLIGTLKLKHK